MHSRSVGAHLKHTGIGLEKSCKTMGGLYSFGVKIFFDNSKRWYNLVSRIGTSICNGFIYMTLDKLKF